MYVVVETDLDYGSDCPYVNNVYGPFRTLEDAERFRSTHPNKVWIDSYILLDPKESS
jgi:hypothetical protein